MHIVFIDEGQPNLPALGFEPASYLPRSFFLSSGTSTAYEHTALFNDIEISAFEGTRSPPVVSALTLYYFLITVGQFNSVIAYDTLSGVALAHAIMISPFAVVMISVSLAQVDRRIDLAARSMGAGLFTRIFSVILPNIRFGLLITFFLTFVLSWEEIAVTIFITSVDAVTLPRLMWTGLRDNTDPAIAAISVILIVIVAASVIGKSAVDACRNGSKKDIEK